MNGFDLSTASEIYMGSSEISALYIGSELIWPSNYENEYFTITSLTNNNSISIEYVGTKYNIDYQFEVSTDKTNWTNYIFNPITETTKTLGLLNNGNRLYIRGNNQRFAGNLLSTSQKHYIRVKTTGSFKISGNIMSLIDSANYKELTSVNTSAFGYLFYNNSWLIDAQNLYLPATTLAQYCYYSMFEGCSSLTTAPELPATTLADHCYTNMFSGCTSLTTVPELYATTLSDYCYANMFYYCTSLTTAPELPATTLSDYCYANMFEGCSSLTTAPELPATTLAQYCYSCMFLRCTSLTTTPELSATTLASHCYNGMFAVCTSLTTAPELPATTLASYCYFDMFDGCSSLIEPPELPATTLSGGCYMTMFAGCTRFVDLSNFELPATTLTSGCYKAMFEGCTSLTKAPELPATTVYGDEFGHGSCELMFYNCTSLVNPPTILPATTLGTNCYWRMFDNCTSLTTAPELPATTLVKGCYMKMFYRCTSLTTAPELPATKLEWNCYNQMFYGCNSLNYIKCLAKNISAMDCLSGWVSYVSSTGTFVKDQSMSSWTRGANGIPSGWTVVDFVIYTITISQTTNGAVTSNVQNAEAGDTITLTVTPDSGYELDTLTVLDASSNPVTVTNNQFTMPASNVTVSATFAMPYDQQYLTIESLEDNNTISWLCNNASYTQDIQYSNDLVNWTTVTSTTSGATLATLNTGDKIYLKGLLVGHNSGNYYEKFSSSGNFKVYGNIMSLTDGDNFASATSLTHDYQLCSLFRSSKVTDVSNLIMPATILKRYCYQNMFNACKQLTTAATILPATSVDYYSYGYMFANCTLLVTPPVLCGVTLGGYAYHSMFYGCSSLTTLPRLADGTTITSWAPYRYMFARCTGIIDARYDVNGDRLLPTHLTVSSGGSAFELMFQDCKNLQYAPELTDMNAHHGEYNQMFKGCTSLYSIITHADSLGTANFDNIVNNTEHQGTVYKAKDVTWDTSQYSQFNYTSGSAWTVIDGDYNAGDYQT